MVKITMEYLDDLLKADLQKIAEGDFADADERRQAITLVIRAWDYLREQI